LSFQNAQYVVLDTLLRLDFGSSESRYWFVRRLLSKKRTYRKDVLNPEGVKSLHPNERLQRSLETPPSALPSGTQMTLEKKKKINDLIGKVRDICWRGWWLRELANGEEKGNLDEVISNLNVYVSMQISS
jgi:hypothetical protein